MATLDDFKRVFGEYKIIKSFKGDKMDKKQVFKVVKQLQIISVSHGRIQ